AFLGAFMTSYARARAECLISRCDVGLAERPERIVLILAGLLFGVMKPAIVILIVVSTLTVLQRIGHTFRQLRNGK
ncbi:MAG TPA: CDP-alcohol phosphatidyltransferase family protein, partial [bacterium]|nr:CDP-alcohol phosphatidyltransferase family protein [bacterium]